MPGMKDLAGNRPFLRQESNTGTWFISWELIDGGGDSRGEQRLRKKGDGHQH